MAPLTTTVTCKSRPTTFNTDSEQQWKLHQHQLLEEEFVNAVNFFCHIRTQWNFKSSDNPKQEDKEGVEDDLEEVDNLLCPHKSGNPKRKMIKLCRHTLQQRTFCSHKIGTKWLQPKEEFWPQQQKKNWQEESRNLELSQDPEWSQLQEVEEYCQQQREKLHREEAQGPGFYWPKHCHQRARGTNLHFQEDLDESKPEEADLEFITSILDSFSRPRSMPALHTTRENPRSYNSFYEENFQDDVSLRGCAKHQAPPQKFSYELMIKTPVPKKVSCEPTLDSDTVDHWD